MPAVRNSKVKQFLEEEEAPSVVRYTMNGKETSTFNIAIKKPRDEDDPKPFATNCTKLEILTQDLFSLYSRRWRIETEYRVRKNNFYPKTTSKDYNIRLFYFLFSQILYNTWILTNVKISLELHGQIIEEQIVTAQEFINHFFQAFIDYG